MIAAPPLRDYRRVLPADETISLGQPVSQSVIRELDGGREARRFRPSMKIGTARQSEVKNMTKKTQKTRFWVILEKGLRRVWEDSLAAKSAAFVRAAIHVAPEPTHLRPKPETAALSSAGARHSRRCHHHNRRLVPSGANRHSEFSQSRIRGRG